MSVPFPPLPVAWYALRVAIILEVRYLQSGTRLSREKWFYTPKKDS